MFVKNLNNETIKWIFRCGKAEKKSKWHILARQLIHETFPTLVVLEELSIPVDNTLYFDFYLPLLETAIEVHGEQHYRYIRHFHRTLAGFLDQKRRDREKVEWCELNKIKLIELNYKEYDEWQKQLKNL